MGPRSPCLEFTGPGQAIATLVVWPNILLLKTGRPALTAIAMLAICTSYPAIFRLSSAPGFGRMLADTAQIAHAATTMH
ncbi:hypothetical protein AWB80_08435 [Caballeronia pedi]|uniref:Uncharacterized protein n=2 Tax=Caballeronia pedi TaxID=1777141 RepID=A0A158E7B7_9BURK|nr:hypothetical protein AWB80_08435 [Caballeronia pedi]